MYKVLDYIVKLLVLLLFTYGAWCFFGPSITRMFKERSRVKRILKQMRSAKLKKEKSKIILHIERIMTVVFQKEIKNGAVFFLVSSCTIFLFSFLLLVSSGNILASLFIALALAFLPYFYLIVRLRTIRIDSSYEGDALVTTLINNYKQNYMNMIDAIDQTSCSSAIGAFSKKSLFKLTLAIKSYRTEEELDEAITRFVFTFDTEWAVLLGMNIKIAIFNGTNVCASLDDILNELKEVREQIEKNKRYNSESFSMIRYVLVPLYLLTVFLAVDMFGFTLKKFINYQFANPLGLRFGILTFAAIAVCFVVLMMTRKPKFDS